MQPPCQTTQHWRIPIAFLKFSVVLASGSPCITLLVHSHDGCEMMGVAFEEPAILLEVCCGDQTSFKFRASMTLWGSSWTLSTPIHTNQKWNEM